MKSSSFITKLKLFAERRINTPLFWVLACFGVVYGWKLWEPSLIRDKAPYTEPMKVLVILLAVSCVFLAAKAKPPTQAGTQANIDGGFADHSGT